MEDDNKSFITSGGNIGFITLGFFKLGILEAIIAMGCNLISSSAQNHKYALIADILLLTDEISHLCP